MMGCGKRSVSAENSKLRAERLELERDVEELQSRLALREQELAAMRAQEQQGTQPIEGIQPPRLAGIKLGGYTGAIDLNSDKANDALRVYVRPVDQHGRQITAQGTAHLTLTSQTGEGSPAGKLLLEKTYDPERFHAAYRDGPTGTHYTLGADLPADLPGGLPASAVVEVALTDAVTGRIYKASKTIELVRE